VESADSEEPCTEDSDIKDRNISYIPELVINLAAVFTLGEVGGDAASPAADS